MTEPLHLRITTRSGKVEVVAEVGATLSVEGAVAVTEPDGSVQVEGARGGSGRISVRCPAGTDVMVGTASGSVALSGPLGDVRIVTASGRVEVGEAQSIEIRSTSAKITVTSCEAGCKVVTRSGSVSVGHAGSVEIAAVSGTVRVLHAGDASVQSVSGKVAVGADVGAGVSVRTVTGRVEVTVPAGCTPSLSLRSTTGRVRNRVAAGTDGVVDVETTAGSIDVTAR